MNQSIDEGLSAQEQVQEEQEHQRMFDDQNAWSNEDEVAEILSHPLDIRTEPVLRDPALVDLQPFRDAVHKERIERDDAAIQRKHERMRELFGEQMCAVPTQDTHDPEKIMQVSEAERVLAALATPGNLDYIKPSNEVERTIDALAWIDARIDGLTKDIQDETDIDIKLSLIADLEEHRVQYSDGKAYLSGLCAA